MSVHTLKEPSRLWKHHQNEDSNLCESLVELDLIEHQLPRKKKLNLIKRAFQLLKKKSLYFQKAHQPAPTFQPRNPSFSSQLEISPEALELLKNWMTKETTDIHSCLKESNLSNLTYELLVTGNEKKFRFSDPLVTLIGFTYQDFYERLFKERNRMSVDSCDSIEFSQIPNGFERLEPTIQSNTWYKTVWKRDTLKRFLLKSASFLKREPRSNSKSLPETLIVAKECSLLSDDDFGFKSEKVSSQETLLSPETRGLRRKPTFCSNTPSKSCLKFECNIDFSKTKLKSGEQHPIPFDNDMCSDTDGTILSEDGTPSRPFQAEKTRSSLDVSYFKKLYGDSIENNQKINEINNVVETPQIPCNSVSRTFKKHQFFFKNTSTLKLFFQ